MKTKKVVKLTQNIYTTHSHTDILSIITVVWVEPDHRATT